MKISFVTLAALIFSSYASAQSLASSAIEGNWGTQVEIAGTTYDVNYKIEKDSVTVTNVCTGFGKTATVQVTAKATYTDSTLSLLESKQDQKIDGELDCNVEVQQDRIDYVVQGSQLMFTHGGTSESLVFIRK